MPTQLDSREVGSLPPRRVGSSGELVTSKLTNQLQKKFMQLLRSNMILLLRSNIDDCRSAPFGQQQVAAIPDRDLRHFGKSLQQPRQCHFEPDVIVRDIEMT